MKFIILGFLLAQAVFAGEGGGREVGNGGGSWVCQEKDDDSTVRWIELVDLYEARKEHGLKIEAVDANLTFEAIVEQKLQRLKEASSSWYETLSPYVKTVLENKKFVDADLEVVDDALYKILPPQRECKGGEIKYVQLANFTKEGTVLINEAVWNDVTHSEFGRAALIVHEAVYAYFREKRKDLNSVRARKFVGYLFSDKTARDLVLALIEEFGVADVSLHGPFPEIKPIEMNFAEFAPGTFEMGDVRGRRHKNARAHFVTLTRPFEIQTTEITQYHWVKVMGSNPSHFFKSESQEAKYSCFDQYISFNGVDVCLNYPLQNALWSEIQEFIRRINETSKDGYLYRLPTEAEWEYAARSGSGIPSDYATNRDTEAWLNGYWPAPVAGRKATYKGLFDMIGNVEEFVQDWYDTYPSSTKDLPVVDPRGPNVGETKVLRGCSYGTHSKYCDVLWRSNIKVFPQTELDKTLFRSTTIGFRLAREKISAETPAY